MADDAQATHDEGPMRLQRFLARCGVASRRASEKLIVEGRVSVNGNTICELGAKVDPKRDRVAVDGNVVSIPQTDRTFKLYKPTGYLTSMSDPHHDRCVSDLVPIDEHPSLYPIGRLDLDTSGLLLFTTDGALGHDLMHPSKHVDKTYIALVDGAVEESELDRLREGISIGDDIFAPAKCDIIKIKGDRSRVSITIHEGKNRQVRRMFKAIGHEVIELERVTFGPITLSGMRLGQCIELTKAEYEALDEVRSRLQRLE